MRSRRDLTVCPRRGEFCRGMTCFYMEKESATGRAFFQPVNLPIPAGRIRFRRTSLNMEPTPRGL